MKTWTNKVQPFLGRKIFGGKFLTHTLHLNILPSLSLSLASPRDGTPRKNARSKRRKREGGRGLFCPCELADRVFQGANNSSVPFVAAIHSTLPSSSFLLSFGRPPPGSSTLRGKRGTEREEEEWRLSDVRKQSAERKLNSGEWTLSKGNGRWYPSSPLLSPPPPSCTLPQCIAEPDTFHYVPLCPMDILSPSMPSFRQPPPFLPDSQIARTGTTDISQIPR